jgi:hypothetical protein
MHRSLLGTGQSFLPVRNRMRHRVRAVAQVDQRLSDRRDLQRHMTLRQKTGGKNRTQGSIFGLLYAYPYQNKQAHLVRPRGTLIVRSARLQPLYYWH